MPHVIWDISRFWAGALEPPPSLTVEVTLISESHTEFSYAPMSLDSLRTHWIIVETGAQTCSSEPEIQKILKCPDKYLGLTGHRIHGITDDQLHIKGILFTHIRGGSKEMRQTDHYHNSSSLEKEGQTGHLPGCCTEHHWTSTSWYPYNLVLKNGGYTKEGRTTQMYGGATETQCRHYKGDAPYSIPF